MNGTEQRTMKQIGQAVSSKRIALGYTLVGLAEACNLQPSQIKAVENGDRSYTIPTLLNICETLGISSLTFNFYKDDNQ